MNRLIPALAAIAMHTFPLSALPGSDELVPQPRPPRRLRTDRNRPSKGSKLARRIARRGGAR